MSWVSLAIAGGGAIAGGVAGGIGASRSNKKIPSIPELPGYSGMRPPEVNYLRPVEDQITQILQRRASGQDVGFDPARLTQLKGIYDINAQQDKEQANEDFNNQLSGTGQSRNLGARNALMGKYNTEAGREKNKYFMGLDVEDLTRRNEERDVNTGRLQNLNTFNFGQQNSVADFDFRKYQQEISNILATRGMQMDNHALYKDPVGTGIETGLSTFGAVQGAGQSNAMASYLRSLSNQNNSPVATPFVENRKFTKPISSRYDLPGRYNI